MKRISELLTTVCICSRCGVFTEQWSMYCVRFPDELKSIEDRGGIVIRINRSTKTNNDHESETALDSHQFTYTINNNGTIEELIQKVKNLNII